ncbi:MAG TPA: geranylgeranylglycerol-phosphate geranylgeranyltransferase [Bacteroidota bacterium]|nr:geranylgeranylglycerol-phosphate geranylgeranyltransferase [Bacteroidota bacterium]
MATKSFYGYWHLVRPVNVLITFFAIVIACWISGATLEDLSVVLLAACSSASVAAGANALNDYIDIEIDKINKPNRPLPSGELTPRQARNAWIVCSLLGIVFSMGIHWLAVGIVLFAILMLYFYSNYWKQKVLIGNFIVALMTGLTFLYGGSAMMKIDQALVPAAFAFLTNLAREVVKDVEDMEGDRLQRAFTLPVRYGVFPSRIIISIVVFATILLSFVVVAKGIYSSAFTVCVIIANILFIAGTILSWKSSDSKTMHTVSSLFKIGMVVGLIGIIGGAGIL